jgi:hypothetical protein
MFRDEGVPGWLTDRGEVFITLGRPEDIAEAGVPGSNRILRWTYPRLQLVLFFQDETGFGRYRLTTNSRFAFKRYAGKIQGQER